MVTGSPANDAGLKVGDFLISVQGMDVFDCDHAQVVTAVKGAGNSLDLAVERYFLEAVFHFPREFAESSEN